LVRGGTDITETGDACLSRKPRAFEKLSQNTIKIKEEKGKGVERYPESFRGPYWAGRATEPKIEGVWDVREHRRGRGVWTRPGAVNRRRNGGRP